MFHVILVVTITWRTGSHKRFSGDRITPCFSHGSGCLEGSHNSILMGLINHGHSPPTLYKWDDPPITTPKNMQFSRTTKETGRGALKKCCFTVFFFTCPKKGGLFRRKIRVSQTSLNGGGGVSKDPRRPPVKSGNLKNLSWKWPWF